MDKTLLGSSRSIINARPRSGRVGDWQRWTPYAAVVWSLVYATLGIYWAVSGRGFPYTPDLESGAAGPLLGRFGVVPAWIIVITAGIPAAAMGTAMLRGRKAFRTFFLVAGALLAGILLLLMTDFNLLVMIAYIPYVIFRLITDADVGRYVQELSQGKWIIAQQLLCLVGGFLWLAATVSYARRSGDACLYCGRRDGLEGWTSPTAAARWGRIAVYVAMVAPVVYALTRYAWVLGIPWGMTEEHLRWGQENGNWISGLFLANFGLLGAFLMLGLVQRWGEIFPRWMIGLAGRRVPIPLAVVPASIMSVLFMVCGIAVGSQFAQMSEAATTIGEDAWIVAGPILLFPLWAVSLAVATLGYYYRRRGPCSVCRRGTSDEITKQASR
jgi:hypothetical protein